MEIGTNRKDVTYGIMRGGGERSTGGATKQVWNKPASKNPPCKGTIKVFYGQSRGGRKDRPGCVRTAPHTRHIKKGGKPSYRPPPVGPRFRKKSGLLPVGTPGQIQAQRFSFVQGGAQRQCWARMFFSEGKSGKNPTVGLIRTEGNRESGRGGPCLRNWVFVPRGIVGRKVALGFAKKAKGFPSDLAFLSKGPQIVGGFVGHHRRSLGGAHWGS